MLFTLVSNKENPEINPLIKEIAPKCISRESGLYIYDSFTYAIECGENANYLNDQIRTNVWWSESLDDTIAAILKEFKSKYKIKSIFSDSFLEKVIHYEYRNGSVVVLVPDLKENVIKVFDKRIGSYFSEDIQCKTVINYDNSIRSRLKCWGLIEKEYTLASLVSYLKKIINENYELYIPIIFSNPDFGSYRSFDSNPEDKLDAWDVLFLAEEYFNQIPIYGLDQSSKYDFNFKKDENGEYYVQYQYNASESVTGRMFPINLYGYQSLQTLPKESRGLLKSEKNCTFIEYDFKSFELFLIQDYYRYTNDIKNFIKQDDPHHEICVLLGLDPIINRSFGKSINYSIVYGMSFENLVELISEKTSLIKVEISEIIRNYSFYIWSQEIEIQLINNIKVFGGKEFLYNYFGRLIKVEKKHALLNNFFQSIASDILYRKIYKIIQVFKENKISEKNKILLQNHDSILIQLENSVILKTDIAERIYNIMQENELIFKPIAEMKSGINWGDLK